MSKRRVYHDLSVTVSEGSRWSSWEYPIHRGYRIACCDCGLVHENDYRVDHLSVVTGKGRKAVRTNGNVAFRVARDNRSTAAKRPDQLEGFIKRFRAKVKRRARELSRA